MNEIMKSVPESFYETFTYLVPSTYLFGGIAIMVKDQNILHVSKLVWPNGTWSELPLFIGIIVGLFVAGQLLNSACHYVLGRGLWPIWRSRLLDLGYPWIEKMGYEKYEAQLRDAKNRFAAEIAAASMPKIAAKKITSLCMTFAGLCLAVFSMVHCLFVGNLHVNYSEIVVISLIMAAFSSLDYWKRMGDEAAYISSLYRVFPEKPKSTADRNQP